MRRALLLLLSLAVSGPLSSRALALQAGRTGAAQAAQPHARSSAVTREALEALEAQLDRAVDRVSLPRVAGLLARDAARGYRLPGYGVVFVLTPRALPGEGHSVLVHVTPRRRTGPRAQRAGAPDEDGPAEVETLERQVVILQSETEQARRAAEQDMERIVHDLRMRLLAPGESPELAHASGEAPPATAPVSAAPPEAPSQNAQPASVEAPLPPLPPPPPWKYWFESGGARDERTPQALVADVRQALLEAFESHAARVEGLRPEEYVTVAVDFEVPDPFVTRPRPEHTIIVRARAADIAARVRAAIDRDEFRRRIEVLEY